MAVAVVDSELADEVSEGAIVGFVAAAVVVDWDDSVDSDGVDSPDDYGADCRDDAVKVCVCVYVWSV